MKRDKINILKDRGLISVSGADAGDFLQNIISNDINKVSFTNSIFAGIFTPQGKYLYEFFIIKSENGYFLECEIDFAKEIIEHLSKFKLNSKIEINDHSSRFVVSLISLEKFGEIQTKSNSNSKTILYQECSIYIDSRTSKLGARVLSSSKNLQIIIKKFNLQTTKEEKFLSEAHSLGIPIKGLKKLKEQLFGLEANFEELNAIDFKKGCYVGQENTARMKLKNKIRRRLLPINCNEKIKTGSEIYFKDKSIGKVLIVEPFAFALIKLSDINLKKDRIFSVQNEVIKIINPFFLN